MPQPYPAMFDDVYDGIRTDFWPAGRSADDLRAQRHRHGRCCMLHALSHTARHRHARGGATAGRRPSSAGISLDSARTRSTFVITGAAGRAGRRHDRRLGRRALAAAGRADHRQGPDRLRHRRPRLASRVRSSPASLVGAFENFFLAFRGVTERDMYVMLLLFVFLVFRPQRHLSRARRRATERGTEGPMDFFLRASLRSSASTRSSGSPPMSCCRPARSRWRRPGSSPSAPIWPACSPCWRAGTSSRRFMVARHRRFGLRGRYRSASRRCAMKGLMLVVATHRLRRIRCACSGSTSTTRSQRGQSSRSARRAAKGSSRSGSFPENGWSTAGCRALHLGLGRRPPWLALWWTGQEPRRRRAAGGRRGRAGGPERRHQPDRGQGRPPSTAGGFIAGLRRRDLRPLHDPHRASELRRHAGDLRHRLPDPGRTFRNVFGVLDGGDLHPGLPRRSACASWATGGTCCSGR